MKNGWNRREFVQTAGSLVALNLARPGMGSRAAGSGVVIVAAPDDPVASLASPQWAVHELEYMLVQRQVAVHRTGSLRDIPAKPAVIVIAAGPESEQARAVLSHAGLKEPSGPEAFVLATGTVESHPVVLACGSDNRGLVYALLELADRVDCGADPIAALAIDRPIAEKPTNRLRSINRCFQSELEDKPWFHDKAMWTSYLTMLTANRFNQFNLSMGLAYDYPQPVTDSYSYFTYPFFLAVPGYEGVSASGLPVAERDTNLEMIRFISSECALRGLDFTLGLWNHAYVMSPKSKPTYPIEGLTEATHAPYCRDALHALLEACPGITGLTMRVHGESGIPEGNYAFWEVVFAGVAKVNRPLTFNLHAKGTSPRIIEMAQATGKKISLTPKYWAEHLGLPYQPSSIRELEKPPLEPEKAGSLFELSSGARRFTRYSYGDLFAHGRKYDVYFRIWPGTQRVLLWGNPQFAAGDSRGFTMCGGLGVDLFEPLSFKARAGSGVSGAPGGRCSYADASLAPRYDWEKFLYSYRVWGRAMYNADADPADCHRLLQKQFGAAGAPVAAALANASVILRIVSATQAPSAANWAYWPEMYTNMTIVDEKLNTVYRDTPEPRVYGNISALDPQMFVSINEAVADLLKGRGNSRYTPFEVATWLESRAREADEQLAQANKLTTNLRSPEYRRAVLDIQMQCGLGKFFCAKIRSAAFFEIYRQTGDSQVLQLAVDQYRSARNAWSVLAQQAKGTYAEDVTYGGIRNMRGHWLDRLPAIEADIAAMQTFVADGSVVAAFAVSDTAKKSAIAQVNSPAARPAATCEHTAAASFAPGNALSIELRTASGPSLVRLKYRRVNQALSYESVEMTAENGVFRASIPENYTDSLFSLQYYFELEYSAESAAMFPGIGPELAGRPYFLVERA